MIPQHNKLIKLSIRADSKFDVKFLFFTFLNNILHKLSLQLY